MFRGKMGRKGSTRALGICPPNPTNFLLLNPDFFFFGVSGPAQKAVLVVYLFLGRGWFL
jgi:hypothetical protein